MEWEAFVSESSLSSDVRCACATQVKLALVHASLDGKRYSWFAPQSRITCVRSRKRHSSVMDEASLGSMQVSDRVSR